jgi:hypothetical protein
MKKLDPSPSIAHTNNFLQAMRESVGSLATLFSVGYSLLIVISIAYNIGFFKYINPQFVYLMGIGDYLNDTLDNLWYFILFVSLIFSSSLGGTARGRRIRLPLIVLAGVLVLYVTIYSMFTGGLENKFFYVLKVLLPNSFLFTAVIVAGGMMVIMLGALIYQLSFHVTYPYLAPYMPAIASILIFVLVVLLPYMVGMSKSRYEREQLVGADMQPHKVNILTIHQDTLKEVFIIKRLDKGLILRQFYNNPQTSDSAFFFLSWNEVIKIEYHDLSKMIKQEENK